MANTVQKAINANDEGAGNAISSVDKDGTTNTVSRSAIAANINDVARLDEWLEGRVAYFPTYYG